MIKNKYLTTAEAAEFLGFSQCHIRLFIRSGQIKAQKAGRTWIITQSKHSLNNIKRIRKDKNHGSNK